MRRGFLSDGFDAGIAAALGGDPDTAREHFERVLREDPLAPWMVEAQEKAHELHAIAADHDAVTAWAPAPSTRAGASWVWTLCRSRPVGRVYVKRF
ncbi:hypothetical protein [Streptomyces sp. TLI_053]|uniref:hypothetical protein n=1 Tax=Streptomyces sp. TLI_053 TaxID=1855352 RepID=UPI000B80D092|nr:hypothetical protein [Streptomyces sp. TLI_053]